VSYPRDERDKVNEMFTQIMDIHYPELSKAEALKTLFQEKLMEPMNQTTPRASEILDPNQICELGFLQRILDPKTQAYLYHCLKQQRPNAKGKPVILSDGRDMDSIRKICEACHTGFLFNQQNKLGADAIKSIIKFGNQDISIKFCSCIHPENDMIFFSLGGIGSFPCKKTDTRVSIEKTCEGSFCDYLHTQEVSVRVKDTEAYKEMRKELEDKTGGETE